MQALRALVAIHALSGVGRSVCGLCAHAPLPLGSLQQPSCGLGDPLGSMHDDAPSPQQQLV